MSVSVSTELSLETSLRQQIDTALDRYAHFQGNCPAKLSEAIRYSLLAPGKRLRPQLVLLAARACGGEVTAALPAAVAVEMIHAYSLVHDDLPAMDNDDLRRGRLTCHKQYDEATAILVGDALQARAFEILATEIEPARRAVHCCAELARAAGAEALVGGQVADLAAESQPVTAVELEAIHCRKTGALFRASLRLGAIVADASPQVIEHLDEYGRHLGLAFQIVDDLLDVMAAPPMNTPDPALDTSAAPSTQNEHHVGKQQTTLASQFITHNSLTQAENHVGKRLGKDQHRGKATYPSLLGIESSRHQVQSLVTRACQAIESLGNAAKPLGNLAEHIGKRSR
jgi:geranylgeranyl diphosphate synthase type II